MIERNIAIITEEYLNAAQDLRSAQVQLQNYSEELERFYALEDELIEHKEFNGTLPATYFTVLEHKGLSCKIYSLRY